MSAALFARVCMLGFMLAAPAQSTRVQNDLAKDRLKYEHADNPVDRAKAIGKFGHEEYTAARQAIDAGKMDEALQFLKDYNNQATDAHDALVKTGVDPEKHSNGFRQLQISVRERERELKELINRVGFEQRPPFEALQKALDALNQKLILELFPRQPGNKQRKELNNP
ncbi:MAG: hypothetical protein WBD87_04730 [Candidatus Acidiferrales bacterium]